MKKVMMMVVVLLISATAIHAQGKHGGGKENHANMTAEEVAKKRTDGMIKRFGFPQDLYAKLYTLKLEHITATRQARATEEVDKATMKAANEAYKAGLQKVLTPAQFQQVKEAWAEAKAKRKEAKDEKGKMHDEMEY